MSPRVFKAVGIKINFIRSYQIIPMTSQVVTLLYLLNAAYKCKKIVNTNLIIYAPWIKSTNNMSLSKLKKLSKRHFFNQKLLIPYST